MMAVNRFKELIETSGDIMFECDDKKFTICTWCEQGIMIGEQNSPVEDSKYFASADELINNFLVNGVPLAKQTDSIKVEFYN